MQHLVYGGGRLLSLLRAHVGPAIPKNLRDVIVVVICKPAAMPPAVGVWFVFDRKCCFSYLRPVVNLTASIGDDVKRKAQIGGLVQPTTTRIPGAPIAGYRVLPSFNEFREGLAVLLGLCAWSTFIAGEARYLPQIALKISLEIGK